MTDRRWAEVERWGFRNAWLPEAWEADTLHVGRWFRLDSIAHFGSEQFTLLTRVLGWDSSEAPTWVAPHKEGRVEVVCAELATTSLDTLVEPQARSEFQRGLREARRLELPVVDWHSEYDAKAWKLGLPLVVHELWPTRSGYERLRQLWAELEENEREAAGLPSTGAGHLGAIVLLIPKVQSFFADAHNLVIGGDERSARGYTICSEAFDGPLAIARSSATIVPEPASVRTPENALRYLALHYRSTTMASLSAPVGESWNAASRLPSQSHGVSGSDWRLALLGREGLIDSCSVGLIRGLGDGYFTSEPWKARAASLGFSAPARVIHVPPTPAGQELAFVELRKVCAGEPFRVADPFAASQQLQQLGGTLAGTRVITGANKAQLRLPGSWPQQNGVDVRLLPSLHDRFIVGPRHGMIMGTSLNGLGKRHSFLVVTDATMRYQLAEAFEQLWISAGSNSDD